MIHDILTRRYGRPVVVEDGGFLEHRWCTDDGAAKFALLMGRPETPLLPDYHGELSHIYGQSVGGFLVSDSLKIAALTTQEAYGLYSITALRTHPEVQLALAIDPHVHFFMDAANTWFYGEKGGHLFVFDRETRELDDLGESEQAIEVLLDEWLAA